jgi:hypothetical protein
MPSSRTPKYTDISPQTAPWRIRTWLATLTALSFVTLLIHGYHPLAEDGGLYVAGVEYTLNPTLFPHDTAFVTEHLSFSLFAPFLAALVRSLRLSLDGALLLVDLLSIALTFVAAHQLLRRFVASEPVQLAGLALLAAWWTLPIAGTSLLLMDPYVTARSFSTPLSLLAIAFALDDWRAARAPATCIASLLLAAAFHPLMAAYAVAFVLTLRLTRRQRSRAAFIVLTLAALLLACILYALAPLESPAEIAASLSRYYWFLSQWQWFELLGLAGPIVLLAMLLRYQRENLTSAARHLIRCSLFLGTLATLIALLFCPQHARAHLVARLQPLRIFLLLYAIMTLLLGATLAQTLYNRLNRTISKPKRRAFAAVPLCVFSILAAIFFHVQRKTFPLSPHIELPGREAYNANPWVQAFLWARTYTPAGARFALDAKYINQDGEDAQTFRAWSLRSALPDFSKDGGEAAITPSLASTWLPAAEAQRDLSAENDATRDPRILPLGATWMIVHTSTTTAHPCLYNNATVKVCRLTPEPHPPHP